MAATRATNGDQWWPMVAAIVEGVGLLALCGAELGECREDVGGAVGDGEEEVFVFSCLHQVLE